MDCKELKNKIIIKMPTLAIVLRGISYLENAASVSRSASVDYKLCLENFKNNLIEPLKTKFEKIDIFLNTYYSKELVNIIKAYNPLDMLIKPESSIKPIDQNFVAKNIAESLDLCLKYNHDYILQTRFDLYYYRKLDMEKVDLNKINFGWVGENGQCDDSWVLFPRKQAEIAAAVCSGRKGDIPCTHYVNRYFSNNECNYISRPLDPYNNYHFPDFYIFQRVLDDYKSGKLKVY
jgi:hypothetical protein